MSVSTKFQAYPDVAAQGDFYKIFLKGESALIGGTSASSPTVAGIVALLNDVRLREQLPPLGFLNPFIYSKGLQGFNDVTTGNAAGCGTVGFNVSHLSSCLSKRCNHHTKGIRWVGPWWVVTSIFHANSIDSLT